MRIGLFLLLILAAVTVPVTEFFRLIGLAAFLAVLIAISGIPFIFVFKRVVVLFPFLIMMALMAPFLKVNLPTVYHDMKLAAFSVDSRALIVSAAFMKSLISVVAVILVLNTGRFADFLKALQKLRVPVAIISILVFVYRYVFITVDQFQRMFTARKSRTFSNNRTWRGLPGMIGVGFIRASERGERVYASMLSRGFDGTIRTFNEPSLGIMDWIFCIAFLSVAVVIRFA